MQTIDVLTKEIAAIDAELVVWTPGKSNEKNKVRRRKAFVGLSLIAMPCVGSAVALAVALLQGATPQSAVPLTFLLVGIAVIVALVAAEKFDGWMGDIFCTNEEISTAKISRLVAVINRFLANAAPTPVAQALQVQLSAVDGFSPLNLKDLADVIEARNSASRALADLSDSLSSLKETLGLDPIHSSIKGAV